VNPQARLWEGTMLEWFGLRGGSCVEVWSGGWIFVRENLEGVKDNITLFLINNNI
jgi:hypothetical protein